MDDLTKQLLSTALRYLGYRPRSKKEIIDFLHKKTSNTALIDQTIIELEKLKLINDDEFASWLIKSRSRNRGSLFIKQDLKKYGINSKSILTNDLETALNLLNKKKFDDYHKAFRYLAYRGIPASIIAQAWKKRYNGSDVN